MSRTSNFPSVNLRQATFSIYFIPVFLQTPWLGEFKKNDDELIWLERYNEEQEQLWWEGQKERGLRMTGQENKKLAWSLQQKKRRTE